MSEHNIYEDIAKRTGGDIYLGVVGPVRTGKSTFIKRFMETLVLPAIEDEYVRERAIDELPQSASGRTIMTSEPKFVPEDAVSVSVGGGANARVRLIDCVGYLVPGAAGIYEDGAERMVTTPWADRELPITEAAELGTRKVIAEHSTVGVVVTTDGTITDIPRENYVEAENRVISELSEIGKPFAVIVNSADPGGAAAQNLKAELEERHGVKAVALNCQSLSANDITDVIRTVLYGFPVAELGINLPAWVDALPNGHALKASLFAAIRGIAPKLRRISDVDGALAVIGADENVSGVNVRERDLGRGIVNVDVSAPRELFYDTISGQSGFNISDDGDLVGLLTELSEMKRRYDQIAPALYDAEQTGYGIVMPTRDQLRLEEPEIVRHGGRYGVKLKASAPSIHLVRANIETEVSPAVGASNASGDVINFLLQEFEGDVSKIWESNMFGKSLYDIAGESLQAKIKKMPVETQTKLQNTLQKIINDGSGGIICIIL
ncbi:MAG: stage IV sporulation protein A [Oscillospiraceae bacterium]|nr:stage IV sporulation protein A [Oscillospiraceae bacterium]